MLFALAAAWLAVASCGRIVTTKYGHLRGVAVTGLPRSAVEVESFLGIPYASPPVGTLRFMPPVTPAHWSEIRTADKHGPACPQRPPEPDKSQPIGRQRMLSRLAPYLRNQSEDCLYLNIFAPIQNADQVQRLPVLVFIHGESYDWNSGNPYNGSVLAGYGNIIVVTLNYRLGILGFLTAEDGSSRGNYGLMDQVAALHWLQENIAEFGGDPNNVTVLGHGHGAACVHLLMVSPMARGLFKRAILQSGSALSPWAMSRDGAEFARQAARAVGCPFRPSSTLLSCMRSRTVDQLLAINLSVPAHLTAFGPSVDEVVVPSDPASLLGNSQCDILIGVTRTEAPFLFSHAELRDGITTERRDRLLRTLVRNLYSYHLIEIFLTVVNEYTDWARADAYHPMSVLEGAADALGDALVVAPLILSGNHHPSPRTFLYVFTHPTEQGDYPERLGCVNGEDLPYVFGAPLVQKLSFFPRNYSKGEKNLSETVMSYWTNFVKTGDPNPPNVDAISDVEKSNRGRVLWPPYEKSQQKYLSLGLKPKARDHYHAHRLSFWLNLIPKLHQSTEGRNEDDHHLLDDHHNLGSYDGIVREVPAPPPKTTPFPQPLQVTPATPKATTPPQTTPIITTPVSASQPANLTDTSQTSAFQQTLYSTALSVTIAIGCSLLILNVLIFAGVYYRKDKTSKELQKRDFHATTA